MKKKFLIAEGIIIVLLAVSYAVYMVLKPPPDISKLKPALETTAESMIQAFETNMDSAHNELNGKILVMEGTITGLRSDSVQFLASFDVKRDYVVQAYIPIVKLGPDLNEGQLVRLKCSYAGYVVNDDEFFIPADIKIEKCVTTD